MRRHAAARARRPRGRLRPAARDAAGDPRPAPRLHDRPAALPPGLPAGPAALPLPLLERPGRAGQHQHRAQLRHPEERPPVPDDEEPLRGQLRPRGLSRYFGVSARLVYGFFGRMRLVRRRFRARVRRGGDAGRDPRRSAGASRSVRCRTLLYRPGSSAARSRRSSAGACYARTRADWSIGARAAVRRTSTSQLNRASFGSAASHGAGCDRTPLGPRMSGMRWPPTRVHGAPAARARRDARSSSSARPDRPDELDGGGFGTTMSTRRSVSPRRCATQRHLCALQHVVRLRRLARLGIVPSAEALRERAPRMHDGGYVLTAFDRR